METFKRLLHPSDRSFFLFGPRGVGKSTWLTQALPDALRLDLLEASLCLELSRAPGALEGMVKARRPETWVILDEIQKVPSLLDEVQRLMHMHKWRFALCGSSARKLRRGASNLLAGRAVTCQMSPFVSAELGNKFNLKFALEWGNLPYVIEDPEGTADILSAYVNTYLKEEIREEGAVRRLEPFVRFLSVAGMFNGQMVNGQNIARDAGVSRSTVDNYFSILTDTLIGSFLPAYRPQIKVREQVHPKFYWFDSGVARAAAGILRQAPDRDWLGRSLETHILHEMRVYNETSGKHYPISFYRTSAGVEIDFIIETRRRTTVAPAHITAIELKFADKWNPKWEGGLRELKSYSALHVDRMIGVYTGLRAYHLRGLDVLPVEEFLRQLHEGIIF
ncbi:MAG: ATP-binding protein [Planctomycetes bacterium]|nr:ATP-binding protein [Planctomycetota bacterium]